MKVYIGTFKKLNGSLRKMIFVKIKDIDSEFLANKIQGNTPIKKLKENQELVWDLEVDNWRIFNWDTLIGKIVEVEIQEELFKN